MSIILKILYLCETNHFFPEIKEVLYVVKKSLSFSTYFSPFYFPQINGKHKEKKKKEKVFCSQTNWWRYYQDQNPRKISSPLYTPFYRFPSAPKLSSAGPSSTVHLETPAMSFYVATHNAWVCIKRLPAQAQLWSPYLYQPAPNPAQQSGMFSDSRFQVRKISFLEATGIASPVWEEEQTVHFFLEESHPPSWISYQKHFTKANEPGWAAPSGFTFG